MRLQVEAEKPAQAKAAEEEEAIERLPMQAEAERTVQAKAAAEAEIERERMQAEAGKTAQLGLQTAQRVQYCIGMLSDCLIVLGMGAVWVLVCFFEW